MIHERRSKSLAFVNSPRGNVAEKLQQRRSRSRSLLRKDSSLFESDFSDDDEAAESREAWHRSKDRRERRRSLGKRKFLRNFLVRMEEKRGIRIIRKWHAWTLVKLKGNVVKRVLSDFLNYRPRQSRGE